jgi:hypothetical protein
VQVCDHTVVFGAQTGALGGAVTLATQQHDEDARGQLIERTPAKS